jgi:hypothetical protein
MADRPILFSGPMVRALLAGTKTQTRRVAKFVEPRGVGWHVHSSGGGMYTASDEDVRTDGQYYAPYVVGDRLYVREAWRTVGSAGQYDSVAPRDLGPQAVWYNADGEAPANEFTGKFRQGMHMPRWASRLTLTVTEVRVQRLQEISEADAIAEGVPTDDDYAGSFAKEYCHHCGGSGVHGAFGAGFGVTEVDCAECETPTLRYRNLWDSLNAARAPWASNPWIVAISFSVHRGNIDAMREAA